MALWLDNPRTDPPWNLAAEEYWLTRSTETVATLWRNQRSVIIGRNQELHGEVDMDFAAANGIQVVRRLSGGGAVFHDLGNINFSYICNENPGDAMSFERFARPLITALSGMGVTAELSGRNDLLADGCKISGCAHARTGGRALYHGTLLFSADLSHMAGVLRISGDKYAGRGIKSVASRVANLNRWLTGMSPEEFMLKLRDALLEADGGNLTVTPYSDEAVSQIDTLRRQKYASMSWTDGADTTLTCLGRARDSGGGVQVWARVQDGLLAKVRLTGDFMSETPVAAVERALTGKPYERASLQSALENAPVNTALCGVSMQKLLEAMFGNS